MSIDTSKNRVVGNKHFRLPKVKFQENERGQAIVLIALLIIVLLGFTALAIDGGGLFVLRRDAQNAADAAALAGAYAKCTSGNVNTVALDSAENDGFTADSDTVITVNDNVPNSSSVEVVITDTKKSYFAQLVYKGPLQVTVHSVGECLQTFDPEDVGAMMALGACGYCSGSSIDYTGANSYVSGGVASNCDCRFSGNGSQTTTVVGALNCRGQTGSSTNTCSGDYTTGSIQFQCCAEPYSGTGACTTTQNPNPSVPPITDPLAGSINLARYQPGGKFALLANADTTCTGSTFPGNAYQDANGSSNSCYHYITGDWEGTLAKNGSGKYVEGLYYVTGNIVINNSVNVGPKGVTFVAEGDINIGNSFAGGSTWGVSPYDPNGDPPTDYIFMYTPKTAACNQAVVTMNGPGVNWNGIVYAPNGACTWSGANSTTANGAFVCKAVDLSGSTFKLIWNPQNLPPMAPDIRFGQP